MVRALRQGAWRGHFRADGEEPYGYAPVTGQLEIFPTGNKLGWYREYLRPYMVAEAFLFFRRREDDA